MSPQKLSIVLPCYNEQETAGPTYQRLKELSDSWLSHDLISDYELIFVNDGSADDTLKILLGLQEQDKRVVIIDLRHNVGFQGAISAGLFSAIGEMIVSIDADLQDDPTKIEEMVNKYYEGYEMVLGVRENRDTDSFSKRLFAQGYYKILKLVGVKSVYNHADFRLLSRALVEELKRFPERVRYLRSLIFELESKYVCVYYRRTSRQYGQTKFSFGKSLAFAIDGLTSFTSRPIKLLSFLGMIMFALSILMALVVILAKYVINAGIPGWASLAIIILFFGGIQNLSLGIVGEYIAKIYIETKQRPIYIVRKEYRRD